MTETYRVSNVVGSVARQGLREIDRLYPLTVAEVDEGRSRPAPPVGVPDQVVRAPDSTFGVLLGFFAPWLVPLAKTHDVTIVIVPAVGDFVGRARHCSTSTARGGSRNGRSTRASGSDRRERSSRTRSSRFACSWT